MMAIVKPATDQPPGVQPSLHTAVRAEPLSLDDALAQVRRPGAGAVSLFVGTVRDHDGGHAGVQSLTYAAHPDATAALSRVAAGVGQHPGVLSVLIEHRTGTLQVGEVAVICAVAAEHRPAAFEACRHAIEELKRTVPIWKQQAFSDGTQEWVGL